jgi:hypothetical protein
MALSSSTPLLSTPVRTSEGPSRASAQGQASQPSSGRFSAELNGATARALSVMSATEAANRSPSVPNTPIQSAFVSRPYAASARVKDLTSALRSSTPVNTAANVPAEDAPRVNAQGQVTGLLLNERA